MPELPSLSDDEISRFWSKVDRSPGPDACWPWLAGRDGRGYGRYAFGGNPNNYAHRASFFIEHGYFPEHTHHICQNKSCVNPLHLENVTTRTHGERHRWDRCKNGHELTPENSYTIIETGKGYPTIRCRMCRLESARKYRSNHPRPKTPHDCQGEGNGNAILTEQMVRDIRALRNGSGWTLRQLSACYGVSTATISRVASGRIWKHVS